MCFVRSLCCAVFCCWLTACVKRVELPEAPPFPSVSTSAGSAQEQTIRQQIKQKEPQFWQLWEDRWRLKPLTGKIAVILRIQRGKTVQCVWRRSMIEGTLQPQTSTSSLPLSPASTTPGLCDWFLAQTWFGTDENLLTLEYVFSR